MLSKELQIGKAAEHLVVCDLIMQGYNAFLADQGLPFDAVVLGEAGKLYRVQVKASSKPIHTTKNVRPHYRFGLRHAKRNSRIVSVEDVDVLAFVALDTRTVGYVAIADMTSKAHGGMVQAVDFYLREHEVEGRIYSTGKRRALWGRFLDDYARFPA